MADVIIQSSDVTAIIEENNLTTNIVVEEESVIIIEMEPGVPWPVWGGAYIHTQVSPLAEWSITHSLGYKPNASIHDSSGDLVTPYKIIYDSNDAMTIQFAGSMAGVAYLS